jgi:cell wall-associated NlpC family hydrolase
MKALPYELWADLLGKPFVEDARGPDAYDCVGLLLEMQRRVGNQVPAWGSDVNNLEPAKEHWERVSDPQPGDAILIRSLDPLWHIGVVCGGGYMIHAHSSCGVVRERHNAFPWHKRIEGFYRWKPI